MKTFSDKKLRGQVSRLLREGQMYFSSDPEWQLNLEGIDSMVQFFGRSTKKAKRESTTHFCSELSLCYLLLLTFTLMTLAIDNKKAATLPIQPTWLGKKRPDPNFIVRSLLTQIVNYSLAVIRLVENGLDNPARCVLRTLNELVSQTLVLLADKSQLIEYAKAHDAHHAKEVWYTLFAKKGRLKKNLSKLEQEMGIPENSLSELRALRDDMDLNFSEAVHHSYVSTVVGAYNAPAETKLLNLALGGSFGERSRSTLDSLNAILVYFLHMLTHVFVNIHHFKFPTTDPFWKAAGLLAVSISKISGNEDVGAPT
jgi:hypothetical protein